MKPKTLLLVLLPLLLLAASMGCTLIGYGVGSAVKTEGKTLSGWEVQELQPGQKMLLSLKDGSELEVAYRGWEQQQPRQYADQYEEWRSSSPFMSWPRIRDSVAVVPDSGDVIRGTFFGFDGGTILVRSETLSGGYRLSGVKLVSTNGDEPVAGSDLLTETMSGTVPLRTLYRFETPSGVDHRVYARDILEIRTNPRGHGSTGFLIGLPIDLVFILAVLVSNSPDHSPEQSCPYVYSFDGAKYVLDAEPLGGAWFESIQRTDFVRLDHPREVDGEYRIRIQTELDETDHLDALEIIVVDGPIGAEVVPSFNGSMFVMESAVSPTRARTLVGDVDVLDRIARRDDEYWISNPFGRDITRPEMLRDGLIVEFARPENADSATIAFTVRSTPWAPHLVASFLELQGDSLAAWYDKMNASLEARTAFVSAFRREALLKMEIWSGTDWQKTAVLSGAEPAVSSNFGIRIALPEGVRDTLRIRLSSSPGLWMIDRIAVDYGPWHADQVSRAKPRIATDESGRPALDEITAVDGRYHDMPEIGQRIDLLFNAPKPLPGSDRTVVLAATGYYTIHVEAEGPPQEELANRILSVPGAFPAWSLRSLYREREQLLAQRTNLMR